MSDLIVTFRHLKTIPSRRGNGFCNRGARPWFERHGLDWRAFVRDGIPAAQMEATGCGLAVALVEWARKCEAEASSDGR
ncbi:hypothetical protein WCE55_02155 [Luteimonas sp. MJ293]|uniref:hypothetical protein n=1 Tax=Luteimonas sp. MJ146 TaxID=3129240 RepID=UPI0031BB4681